jgi:hypothetical protein
MSSTLQESRLFVKATIASHAITRIDLRARWKKVLAFADDLGILPSLARNFTKTGRSYENDLASHPARSSNPWVSLADSGRSIPGIVSQSAV